MGTVPHLPSATNVVLVGGNGVGKTLIAKNLAHHAALRRLSRDRSLPPVRSLAYYRHVLDQLSPDELESGYVDFIAYRCQALAPTDARLYRQNRALPERR